MDILVEILFDVFMNHEIVLINEAKFKPLFINFWRKFLLKNSYLQTLLQTTYPYFPQSKEPDQKAPAIDLLARSPSLDKKIGSSTNLDVPTLERRNSAFSNKSTEGTEASTENRNDSDELASAEGEE